MMRKLQSYIPKLITLFFALLVPLGCCSIHFEPVRIHYGTETPREERLILSGNQANAALKWKKYVGTPFFQVTEPYYMTGGSPALLPDGKIYYQDQRYFYVLDPFTGHVESKHAKPDRSETHQFDFEHACLKDDQVLFPLQDYLSDRDYVMFDRIKNKIIWHSRSYKRETSFCEGDKIVFADNHGLGGYFEVVDAGRNNVKWKSALPFGNLEAVELNDSTTFLVFKKGATLSVRAYKSNYKSGRFFGRDTGELYWEQTLDASKNAEYRLCKLDQLVLSKLYFGQNAKEIQGEIISFDPSTGNRNWQLKDAVLLPARYLAKDPLIYVFRPEFPGIISGIDQTTGEEKLRFPLNNFNFLYGLIVTADQLIFANTARSNENPFADYISGPQASFHVNMQEKTSFISIDKKTGQVLWQSDVANAQQLLNYSDGILYLGGLADNVSKMFFNDGRKMKAMTFIFFKKVEIPQNCNCVMDKASFIDSTNGNLITAALEGDYNSYVEKIFMKNNMAFIKSLSGWLYAIELKR